MDLRRNRRFSGYSAKVIAEANVPDTINNGEIHFIINTPSDHTGHKDEVKIRSTAGNGLNYGIVCLLNAN